MRFAVALAIAAVVSVAFVVLWLLVTQPPFSEKNFEANYSVVLTYTEPLPYGSFIKFSARGWAVVGVGPTGNYTHGVLYLGDEIPLINKFPLEFLSVSEGRRYRSAYCVAFFCQTTDLPPFLTPRLQGEVVVKGTCNHLGYSGALVEARGRADPNYAVPQSGIYETSACVVNGVPVKISITIKYNATVRIPITIPGVVVPTTEVKTAILQIDAVAIKIGPYNTTRYQEILKQIRR